MVKAYIDRIRVVNPYLNAVIENRFEAALNDAKVCDEELKSGKYDVETLEKEKALFGIPLTVKESCSLKGTDHFSLCGILLTARVLSNDIQYILTENERRMSEQ